MFAKTTLFTYVALALVAVCLADPAPEAKPSHGCGCNACCTVERCHTVPYSACIPIHTTHRLIPSSNCGCGFGGYGYGNGGYGGWGNGLWGGYGCGYGNGAWGGYGCGYGNGVWGGYGCGCGCGYGCGYGSGYGNGAWGNGAWGNGYGCGCGTWGGW